MPRTGSKTRQYKFKTNVKEGFYHIYNRGVAKCDIFLDVWDYRLYLHKLQLYLQKFKFSLIYYCLMPNHVHLFVLQNGDSSTSTFIHALHTSYSMYFNRKNQRVGSLFQNRFKQTVVDSEDGIKYLGKYIHLNPVKAGMCNNPENYYWSSGREYLLDLQGLVDKTEVLKLFSDLNSYKDYLYNPGASDTILPEMLI